MKFVSVLMICACIGALGGCHRLRANAGCHAAQEYQKAQQLPPLKVPAGLDAPSKASPLVIPSVASDIPVRGRRDACLEEPPKYKASAPNKPLPQS
jgi:uncharacterized lipoprotein